MVCGRARYALPRCPRQRPAQADHRRQCAGMNAGTPVVTKMHVRAHLGVERRSRVAHAITLPHGTAFFSAGRYQL